MMQTKPAASPDRADPSEWQAVVSGNAELELSAAPAGRVTALRMDFDFKGAGGFVVARRMLSRRMPEEYAVTFRLRGRGPVNNLELKLVDAAGQNVWRHVYKDLRLPARWKRFAVRSEDIDFAWGPSSGGRLSMLGSMELAVVAGEGGRGTLWVAGVEIEDCTPKEAPRATASSALAPFEASGALLGSGWKPRPEDPRPWIVIDSMQPRGIGGLIIDWLDGAPASGFRVRASMSGRRWKTLYTARAAAGNRSYIYLPGLRTRLLRLELDEPSAGAALRVQSFEFSRSMQAFWSNIAGGEPRGWHPRWLHNEQSMWTPFGTADGVQCALMNDDGMVEVDPGSFSIEPMLWVEGRLFTWADVIARQELLQEWIPVPSVIWESGDWRLRMQAEATPGGVSRVRYRLENLTGRQLFARLFVLVRPFQVTPPWQSFHKIGGVSPVHSLEWRDAAVLVNRTTRIVPARGPEKSGAETGESGESGESGTAGTGAIAAARFGALSFDQGFMAAHLASGTLPAASRVDDPFGFATGAIEFELSPEAYRAVESAVNFMPAAGTAAAAAATAGGAVHASEEPAFDWNARIREAQWTGNGWMTEVALAALTATAHILVTRSGPAIQPGPRRYTRSWIRDGAMMSAALLRMGCAEEVREFIRWYAPHQRADGFVPCCVDREGVDWLVEHDSHGELLALIADYWRFTADGSFLEESWKYIEKAVACIEGLLGPDGLLPISASHEGYLAQPVHSYWDDFWALRGLRDAADLAHATGRQSSAQSWAALSTRLAASLFASIETTRAQRKLDFVPGSIEWADFDPTATANAIYLLDIPEGLDRRALNDTFDKYLADWRRKRSGEVAWSNYTPYEIRIIGALVRLGRRDAALELLRFFLSDRRPQPWNQWPEIVWRDPKAAAHIGDLPHTWISAEYVLAVRSLLIYERDADRCLVLAAGLASEWIDGAGVQVNAIATAYGTLSYTLRRLNSTTLRFEITSRIDAKLLLRPPLTDPLRGVTVDGRACTSFDAESVTLAPGLAGGSAEVICSM